MAPTKGLRKNGMRLYGSKKSRPGQLVRALIQASETPKKVARIVEPLEIKIVFTKAFGIIRSVTINK